MSCTAVLPAMIRFALALADDLVHDRHRHADVAEAARRDEVAVMNELRDSGLDTHPLVAQIA